MNKIQRMGILALAATLAVGGSTALAKGRKNNADQPAGTEGTTVAGKKHQRHPHGIVTAVGEGSITIEKGKKHRTKTFRVAANVVVEKKGHGKKHGGQAQDAVGAKRGKHAQGGARHTLSAVKVGDHVRLTLAGKEVVKILDMGVGKGHKHGQGVKGAKQNAGLGQGT